MEGRESRKERRRKVGWLLEKKVIIILLQPPPPKKMLTPLFILWSIMLVKQYRQWLDLV